MTKKATASGDGRLQLLHMLFQVIFSDAGLAVLSSKLLSSERMKLLIRQYFEDPRFQAMN